MTGIRVRDLTVALDGQTIIDGLDLTVEEGEFLVLLGPSGCGKSTLLHALAGLTGLVRGSVEIGGVDMTEAEPSARGIGMVFQSYALYPSMTVEGNLGFGLRARGAARAEVARRVAQVAALLQLEPLLQRRPAQLSGGQRQRVAIGRALVREPRLYLFDEPLSNLDAQLRADLRRELKALHQRLGATMVYVTHDQAEAMTLATRIAVLRGGRLQQTGTPLEVYARPANRFVAGFLGAPAMQFVRGELDAAQRLQAGALVLDLRGCGVARARAVELGLRPEHVRLQPEAPYAARVTLTEPLGHQQLAWLDAGGHTLAALLPAGQACAPGEAVRFAIDVAQASLFDADSGDRL